MNEFDPVALGVERDRLLAEARTVLMAAPGDDAMPEMGVTPVVRMDGALYIYPSRLSRMSAPCWVPARPPSC